MELFQENVVVAANNFNVTIITQLWLTDHEVVRREEFVDPCVFTPGFVQVPTPRFRLLAIPNQIQYDPLGTEDEKQSLLVDRLGRLISALPETPYSALGINFVWHHRPKEGELAPVSRRLFFKADAPFAKLLDAPDAKFGAYFSKGFLGFRLKLLVGPADKKLMPEQPAEEIIQCSFNYHLESKSPTRIVESLARWSDLKRHSSEVIKEIEAAI